MLTAPPEVGSFPILIMTSFGNEEIAVEAIESRQQERLRLRKRWKAGGWWGSKVADCGFGGRRVELRLQT